MSDTAIQWTNKVWNPLAGCSRVSAGCDNCYAFTLHDRRYATWRKGGWPTAPAQYHRPFSADWHDPVTRQPQGVQLLHARLAEPFSWGNGARVFVNSMSDLFHESVPDEFIAQVFGMMALTPRHTYQVLTKRPARMRAWVERRAAMSLPAASCAAALTSDYRAMSGVGDVTWRRETRRWQRVYPDGLASVPWPLPNVWLGTSVEDQAAAAERVPDLLSTLAAVRFLSCEPLLGPLHLYPYLYPGAYPGPAALTATWGKLDWVIIGGESSSARGMKRHGRMMDLDWAYGLLHDCRRAGVAVFVKQLGTWIADEYGLADAHGGDMREWPSEADALRVRAFPRVPALPRADEAEEVTL